MDKTLIIINNNNALTSKIINNNEINNHLYYYQLKHIIDNLKALKARREQQREAGDYNEEAVAMFETIKFMAAVIFLGLDLELAINLVENQNKISFVENFEDLPFSNYILPVN
jgi:hypothetical protein